MPKFEDYLKDFKAAMLRENKWLATLPQEHQDEYIKREYHERENYTPRYRKITFKPELEREILMNLSDRTAFSSNCAAFEDAHLDPEDEKIASGQETVDSLEKYEPARYEEEMKGWFEYHMYPYIMADVVTVVELAEPTYDVVYSYDDTINGHILEEPLENYYKEVEENDKRIRSTKADKH